MTCWARRRPWEPCGEPVAARRRLNRVAAAAAAAAAPHLRSDLPLFLSLLNRIAAHGKKLNKGSIMKVNVAEAWYAG